MLRRFAAVALFASTIALSQTAQQGRLGSQEAGSANQEHNSTQVMERSQLPLNSCQPMPVGDQDGVAVAPKDHKLLYEDQDVRIIEVNVPAHYRDPFHTELRPSVYLILEDAHDKIYADPALGGAILEPPVTARPRALWLKPAQSHSIENIDSVRQYGIQIELKHPGCGPSPARLDDSDALSVAPDNYKLDFENEDVRVAEVTIAPLKKESMHREVWPAFIYVDHTGTNDELASIMQAKPIFPRMYYIPPGGLHALENRSDAIFHAFRIEIKRSELGAPPAR